MGVSPPSDLAEMGTVCVRVSTVPFLPKLYATALSTPLLPTSS